MITIDDASDTVSNYLFTYILSLPVFQKTIKTIYLTKCLLNVLHLKKMSYINTKYSWDKNINCIDSLHWMVITPKSISSYLRHSNALVDNILHQSHLLVIEKTTGIPIVYLPKYIPYSSKYVAEKWSECSVDSSVDSSVVSVNLAYIGEYIVLFHANDKWMFFCYDFKGIKEFNKHNDTILYEHLESYINKLDKTKCHHIVLVDNRIKNVIGYPFDSAFIVYIKSTNIATLVENTYNPYDFFVSNEKFDLKCINDIKNFVNILDEDNNRIGKLHKKGVICCIDYADKEKMYVEITTEMYDYVLNLLPKQMGVNTTHLFLYQSNQLNNVLKLTHKNSSDIVKRIHTSMITMEREILDIYHMTRKQNNGNLYKMLPASYKKILYAIHNQYIKCKNDTNNEIFDSVSMDIVRDVLKTIDFSILISVFVDRIVLCNMLQQHSNLNFFIKQCIFLAVQSHLINNEMLTCDV